MLNRSDPIGSPDCRLVTAAGLGHSLHVEIREPGGLNCDPLALRQRAAALCDLHDAGHYEQVVVQGRQLLEADPGQELTHYVLALACARTNRLNECWGHVQFLLGHEPDWAPSHEAASIYFRSIKRFDDAWSCIQAAIRLNPTVAAYHAAACSIAVSRRDLDGAVAAVNRARQLDPNDPGIAWLAVELKGANQTTARESWQRLREFERALELDANHPGIHGSIGRIYLDELDMPREAEAAFRSALLHDPTNSEHQKGLFQAVAKQRMLYRLLSISRRAYAWLAGYFRGVAVQPWRIVFLLLGFKIVIAFCFWLSLVTIVFWPAGKLYEWLVISEIECASEASDRHLRFKRALNRRPFWLRFLVCVGLILGGWLALFALLGGVVPGFIALAMFIGVHFVLTLAVFLLRRARSSHGRWSADRMPATPPPLPMPTPPPLPGAPPRLGV